MVVLFIILVLFILVLVSELVCLFWYDLVLIYEFVYNNIEYLLMWSMLKGLEGVLIDGVGMVFDIV